MIISFITISVGSAVVTYLLGKLTWDLFNKYLLEYFLDWQKTVLSLAGLILFMFICLGFFLITIRTNTINWFRDPKK